MKYLKLLGPVILAFVVLLTWGCERKVVVENGDDVDDGTGAELALCIECHTDGSGPPEGISNQFAYSVHGSGNNTERNRLTNDFYRSCEPCHTSEGFIAYATGVPAEGDHFSAFDCFTCHTPHATGTFEPRITAAYTLEDGTVFDRGNANLCANCHHSRRDVNEFVTDDVTLSSHWGPHHSNQADMLIGANAYEYADYSYTDSWHAEGVTNGCVACHMSASLHESVGGHSFNMRNEARGFENITGCNVSGCHGPNPVESV
jgi:hypothetical protein